MIGRLRGILISKQPPALLIDVQGVGYEVEAPMSTFYQLPDVGEETVLHTHLIVREDAHVLCGFASENERRMFRALIKINGVGAKLALAILSGMSADEFAQCIHDSDTAGLTRLPGVGKKTAERLIVEMKDRLSDWQDNIVSLPTGDTHVADGEREAVSALIALGYKPQEASKMVASIDKENLSSEDIIRAALKSVVNR
ncbi:MAG: Holliday junction branch migration protein RuvA [Gammaproteobacteria bacterium]